MALHGGVPGRGLSFFAKRGSRQPEKRFAGRNSCAAEDLIRLIGQGWIAPQRTRGHFRYEPGEP